MGTNRVATLAEQIASTRTELVEAQIVFRKLADAMPTQQARAEQRAIETAGGEKALGANAESRERALLLALGLDTTYQSNIRETADARAAVDRLTTELETLLDARREREWAIRERLADALGRRGSDATADEATIDEPTPEEIADAYEALPF